MGLLDEAIREHLELKRRSGADPTAVERAEHEALAPALPGADAGVDAAGTDLADAPAAETAPADPEAGAQTDGDARLAGFQAVGQDTAELDMQAVMAEDADPAQATSSVGSVVEVPERSAYPGDAPGRAPAEWDLPSEQAPESGREDVPGQERLSFE
jgi:hypothetical protein